jgi:hypothetical protein
MAIIPQHFPEENQWFLLASIPTNGLSLVLLRKWAPAYPQCYIELCIVQQTERQYMNVLLYTKRLYTLESLLKKLNSNLNDRSRNSSFSECSSCTSLYFKQSGARTRLLAVSTVVESNYNCSDDKRPKQKVTR